MKRHKKPYHHETPEEQERRKEDERRDALLDTPLTRRELIGFFENMRTRFGGNGTHESDVIADFCERAAQELTP